MEKAGAGEILLTSMDRDGTRDGFDIELTRAVSDAVGIPVIASGGVGTAEHFAEGVHGRIFQASATIINRSQIANPVYLIRKGTMALL